MTTINVKNIEGTRCFCDADAADAIRSIVERTELSDIHFIGSGDYHYITLFLLEKIREPFALVLVDKHSDAQEGAFGNGLLSCGNWVLHAKELTLCKAVFHPCSADEAIEIPQNLPVYISIDLDALSPQYAETNWDQGTMNIDDICKILFSVTKGHGVIGADICGAPENDSPSALNELAIKKISEILLPYISKTAEL